MPFKKPLKISFFQAANILISILLITCFAFSIRQIIHSFRVARLFSLGPLKPDPINYLWETNIHHAPINKNLIRSYVDYYENLLQIFPFAADVYGILGYCYHYIGEDKEAKESFKKAITGNPDYFWYYYDLAILYLNDHNYPESQQLLQKAVSLEPQTTLKSLADSQAMYPLLPQGQPLMDILPHLKEGYQQSIVLLNILNHSFQQRSVDDILKQMKLELYVF